MSAVTIPGIGPVDKKWVWAGGAVVAGLVGYSFFKSTGSSTPDTIEETIPDGAGEDVADGWGNVPGKSGDSSGHWGPDGDQDPRTAAEWTQQAVDKLSAMGWDAQLVATAIGKWLGRQGLTVPEQEIIRTAKAVMGPVPGYSPEPPILPALPTPPVTIPPLPKPIPRPSRRPSPSRSTSGRPATERRIRHGIAP